MAQLEKAIAYPFPLPRALKENPQRIAAGLYSRKLQSHITITTHQAIRSESTASQLLLRTSFAYGISDKI